MALRRKKPKNVIKSRKDMRKDMRMEKRSKQKEFLKFRRENKLKKKGKVDGEQNEHGKKFNLKMKRPFKKQNQFENGKTKKNHGVTRKKNPKNTPLVISPKLLEVNPDDSDFEDEEIDSDELSGMDSENEETQNNVQTPVFEDKMAKAREKEANKLQKYEDGLKKRRVEQLEQANEEEDKVISKYEKLLKLNKRKGKKDALTSFNDGLDYILELCTKDSIEKMYNAAKEAAELENDDEVSDNNEVTGIPKSTKNTKENGKKKVKGSERLRKIEEKYFGEDKEPETIDLEDLKGDSDDSESNLDDEDLEPAPKRSKTDKKVTFKGVKEVDSDGNSDFDILDSDQSEGSDEFSENESSPEQNDDDLAELFKNKKRKNYVMAPPDSDIDESADNIDSDDELARLFKDKKKSSEVQEQVHEDIYGRKCDAKGNLIVEEKSETKYIPPHLRAKNLAETTPSMDPKKRQQLDRLKKQLKGQINRLAESNVQRIAIDIENLYMQHARYDMNTTLTELIISALVSNVLSKERMVLEHMLLVATLHANIGSEIGKID